MPAVEGLWHDPRTRRDILAEISTGAPQGRHRDVAGPEPYGEHFVLNSARTDGSWTDTKIFTGWKTRTRTITPGDVTGDYLPDVLPVDSGGTLSLFQPGAPARQLPLAE